ncbi:MAG: 4-hydroxy-3-methylbut-2-enyl diphosphate reductase [Deferribacteres bacterium]|nr:4-hydroxy-3-methylbut-2-enyl diphosphate reductase [candidate division KSB1 bacterium]MCB9512547.1 4-hydroxy-3-methylbut-2-enyl diphosphate reductase [Deferribacteres bacterium]
MDNLQTAAKPEPSKLFRRGLGLKNEVAQELDSDYASSLIDQLRANEYQMDIGNITVFLAKEFGFCYGVDRAIDYAYQTRRKFPDKRVFLTGEIIHNPHVNNRMLEMGIEFLSGQYAKGNNIDVVQADDVVILPAFGVTTHEMEMLIARGCILVDTTCGSVLNVWKRVEKYASTGFTSVIHGKYYHEETLATSSQTAKFPGAHYLVVLDMKETEMVCDYIGGKMDKSAFMKYFKSAMSNGFDPDLHLQKIGVANQTTMLSNESLAIGRRIEMEMAIKYGEENLAEHFRTFDTICSATQERQDAILELVEKEKLDIMLIVGGYNSSNTSHLAEISGDYTSAYHIDDARCLVSAELLKHQLVGQKTESSRRDWLPAGPLKLGITAGASTPNSKIAEVLARLAEIRGVELEALLK